MTDERRFVNNPFARALHPKPSRSLFAKVALGIVSLLGAILMTAALLLPIVFVPGLLVGGAHARRWGMVAAGILIVLIYLAIIVGTIRRLLVRRRSQAPHDRIQP